MAARLSTRLADTLAVLQSGMIDLPRARAISEATEELDDSATVAVQARVLSKAPKQTVGELRAALSRAVLAADPHAAERRHRAARNDRRVQLHVQRWRAALVDEQTGQLTNLSIAYRPRRLLNLFVQARDRTCCFPGCRQPARRCDLDHTIPYDQGGPTVAGNLGPLCRYHHRLKTHTSWSLCQPEPGLVTMLAQTCLCCLA